MTHKRIILMRHAKSSWKSGAPTDHLRPLNKRGQRDAPRIAEALAQMEWTPDCVLSSDSTRTRQTWDLMAGALESPPEAQFEPKLYLAGPDELRPLLADLPNDKTTVLLLGHNPGWEHALEWFTGQSSPIKTACAALLVSTAESWSETIECPGQFQQASFLSPKSLPDQ